MTQARFGAPIGGLDRPPCDGTVPRTAGPGSPCATTHTLPGLVIACWLMLGVGCAGLPRPGAPEPQQPSAAEGTAQHPAAGLGAEAEPPPPVAVDTVAPAAFHDPGDAPSPSSDEFKILTENPDQGAMSLEEVLQHTLDCHPLLRARMHEVEAARGRLITAGLLSNPQWVMDSESPVDESRATILSTRLTFELPTAGKRRKRMATAEAGVARSQAALARETELVLAEAADAALEVLYLQELADLQGSLSELASKTATIVAGQFQAGTTSYVASIRSRLDAEEMQLARLETLGSLEQAQVRLSRAAGLPPAPLVQMRGELSVEPIPAVPLELVLAEARRCRPDLAESRATLLESQRQYDQERADARPDIVLGPRVQNALGEKGDRVGARMSVNVPLFDRNQGGIAESAAMIRTQRALLNATEINALSDVAAAYLELQAVQRRLDYHRSHVQSFVEQTEAAIRGAAADRVLDSGQISELTEQLARIRVEQLELRYLHARLNTRLEVLLGCGLDDLNASAG